MKLLAVSVLFLISSFCLGVGDGVSEIYVPSDVEQGDIDIEEFDCDRGGEQ